VAGNEVKVPVVPFLYSMADGLAVVITFNSPSYVTSVAKGVSGRLGNVKLVGDDASEAGDAVALKRTDSTTSAFAVAAGMRFDMFRVAPLMAVHLVPFVLYSIAAVTPIIVSSRKSMSMPVGGGGVGGSGGEAAAIGVMHGSRIKTLKVNANIRFFTC